MNDTNETTVTRLLEARDEQDDSTDEMEKPFVTSGEFELVEAEKLLLENLELKQEVYRQRLRALEYEMTGVVARVRTRLFVDPACDLQFSPRGTVQVVPGS